MKYMIKKVASVMASVALVGATAGFAAAAAYPQPFVQNGAQDVAIVVGANAAGSDMLAATDIGASLSEGLVGSSVAGETPEGGDFIALEKKTDKFNLGDTASTFYITIDDDELSEVLSEGVYKNDDNDEFDYQQEIVMGGLQLKHFTDNDFNDEEPVIGFDIAKGDHVLNYTLDFTPDNAEGGTDWVDLEGTTIEMLGREYYILSASNSTETLELLDSASDGVLNYGETITLETASDSYEVSMEFINDDTVRLMINGETTEPLNDDETYKLDSGDYVGIKNILYEDVAGTRQVEFSIGSGKIKLVNGDEVEINNEDVSDLTDHVLNAYITQNNGELDSFTLEWKTDDEHWLGFGTDSTELVMPGFETIKLNLGNFVTDTDEMTSVDPDSDDSFTLDTTVTDGDVSFNFLFTNGTDFVAIGKDKDELLVTNSSSDPCINWNASSSWFVANWISGDDSESYVLEVSDIDDTNPDDNSTTIKSVASGSNNAITLDIDETDEIGQIQFKLIAANEDDETATIELSAAGGGSATVTADKLVTAEGLKIQLPYELEEDDAVADGGLNMTAAASHTMNFTEETKDGAIDEGDSFTITLGHNSGETTVSSVSVTDYETTDGSDDYLGYVESDLATRTMYSTGGDQDSIDITYHGTQAYAEVFVSEAGVTLGGGSGSTIMPIEDTDAEGVDSNLIVVGGSCVNSVAATLIGGPLCESDFTSETGVGSGEYLIQTFRSPYASKVATLVAGYNAADTTNAANALQTRTVMIEENKKYVGDSSGAFEEA
jgi:hypothetical protein